MPTVHLIVKGSVQGVFYRATAKNIAEKIGITGWIKNTKDGDVEIMATGTAERLKQFIDWCKKGPAKAIVTEILISPKPDEAFDLFYITR